MKPRVFAVMESRPRRREQGSYVRPLCGPWGMNAETLSRGQTRKEIYVVLGKTDLLNQFQETKHLDSSFCKIVYSYLKEIAVGVFRHLQPNNPKW